MNQTFNVTPNSGGCTTTSATTCKFTIFLPPDSYFQKMYAYSGANATGQVLSAAPSGVTYTVVKGVANHFSGTMYGIPSTWSVTTSTSTGSPYNLSSGMTPTAFNVTLSDAAGHTIPFGGTGGPTILSATPSGNISTHTTMGSATFTAIATSSAVATSTIALAPTFADSLVCSQPTANCFATISVKTQPTQRLVVANHSVNTVTIYDPPYTSPTTTIATGTSAPYKLAIDSSKNLFVGLSNSTVNEYAPPYTGAPVHTMSASGNLIGMTLDSSGNLFLSNGYNIYEFAPPYTGAPTTLSPVASPTDIAIGASNNLFVVSGGSLYEVQPPYTSWFLKYVGCAPSTVASLYVDPSSNIFVTLPTGVGEVSSPYIGCSQVATSVSSPRAVTVISGNLWVVSSTGTREFASPYTGSSIGSQPLSGSNLLTSDAAGELIETSGGYAPLFILNGSTSSTSISTGIGGPTAALAI